MIEASDQCRATSHQHQRCSCPHSPFTRFLALTGASTLPVTMGLMGLVPSHRTPAASRGGALNCSPHCRRIVVDSPPSSVSRAKLGPSSRRAGGQRHGRGSCRVRAVDGHAAGGDGNTCRAQRARKGGGIVWRAAALAHGQRQIRSLCRDAGRQNSWGRKWKPSGSNSESL
jgi:hypothetical protein